MYSKKRKRIKEKSNDFLKYSFFFSGIQFFFKHFKRQHQKKNGILKKSHKL